MHEVVAPTLPILPYDEPAAAWHAEVRAQRERLGRPIAFADGQIAAIAHVHSLVVVTANVADFDGLEGVAVENWIALTPFCIGAAAAKLRNERATDAPSTAFARCRLACSC